MIQRHPDSEHYNTALAKAYKKSISELMTP